MATLISKPIEAIYVAVCSACRSVCTFKAKDAAVQVYGSETLYVRCPNTECKGYSGTPHDIPVGEHHQFIPYVPRNDYTYEGWAAEVEARRRKGAH